MLKRLADLATERMELYRREFESLAEAQGRKPLSRSFFEAEYRVLLERQALILNFCFANSFKSLDGKRLVSSKQINVIIDYEDMSFSAFIETRENSIVTDIHVSLGAIFLIDVISSIFVSHEVGELPDAGTFNCDVSVIPPFLMGFVVRLHAACFSFMAGVIPPMPILGR